MRIDLGNHYNEQFRRYLLGEADFPQDAAVWISVVKTKNPPMICISPYFHDKKKYHQFEMQIFGVRWSLFVGQRLDQMIRATCSSRSPQRFIYVSDSPIDLARRGMGNLLKTAHQAENVRYIP